MITITVPVKYKNIELSLNKIWENDEITYSLSDIKNA